MSRSTGNIIADSLELCLGYAERLLVGISENDFGRFASTGRTSIQSNHPAFIYGHLSLYAPQIVTHLGRESPNTEIPESFSEVFSKDATCQDDPEHTIYPARALITTVFFAAYREALDSLRTANDDLLQVDNPTGGRMTEMFPTVGSMLNFYSGGHFMVHMGQLSAWRRMKGMGPA